MGNRGIRIGTSDRFGRGRGEYIYIYIHIHTYIYIYILISILNVIGSRVCFSFDLFFMRLI